MPRLCLVLRSLTLVGTFRCQKMLLLDLILSPVGILDSYNEDQFQYRTHLAARSDVGFILALPSVLHCITVQIMPVVT